MCDGTARCGNLRAATVANKLTGDYYRPEDAEKDLFALADGR